jgi:hypothetical protein
MKRCLLLYVNSNPGRVKARVDILGRWNKVECSPENAIPTLLNYDFDLAILSDSIGAIEQASLVGYIGAHFYTMQIVLISDLTVIRSPRVHPVTPQRPADLKQTLEELLEHGDAAA